MDPANAPPVADQADADQEGAPTQDSPGEVAVEQPGKLLRIAMMVREMLEEVRRAPLDENAREHLADIHARVITELAELNRHVAEWEAWEAGAAQEAGQIAAKPPLGFVISMEGADPILSPDQLQEWWEAGLRLLGLTHYGPGRYAGGTGTELGLTAAGPALLDEMERLGVILDLTHCSDQSFWQALDQYNGPVLASHNNCRALVPHQRQFGNEQLQAIIQRDGVIGAACDA